MISASVSWPAAPLTDSLVRKALQGLSVPLDFVNREDLNDAQKSLQWSSYDEIDHELTLSKRDTLLASSYTFRKALIRKHFLSSIIKSYLTKKPNSILNWACPRTFELEISFADELDEMWADELWELGSELESRSSWWILKPGMADRGMGIRVFRTKDDLQSILESFEEDSDSDTDENSNLTSVVISQLRHFVIQEYVQIPLLLDLTGSVDQNGTPGYAGRKFHLRAYCISSGDIKVYLYTRILALFSSEPYTPLDTSTGDISRVDLRPHLTNTSLQTGFGDSNVRLLDELEGCLILSGDEEGATFSRSHIDELVKQMADVVAEVFRAALQNPIHFQLQPLPNAFELFGIDFLVSHTPNTSNPFHVKILEINSEPAIELTGPRLNWILIDLFSAMANVCIEPFFADPKSGKDTSETQHHLLKCLDEKLRPS